MGVNGLHLTVRDSGLGHRHFSEAASAVLARHAIGNLATILPLQVALGGY